MVVGGPPKYSPLWKKMSLLAYLLAVTCNDRNNSAKSMNGIVSLVFLVVFALAIFLAIRDMGSLEGTMPKVWLFMFAVFAPELYVIIHGLSSSTMGIPFFSESVVDVPAISHLTSPGSSVSGGTSSPVSALASEIKKAAAHIKAGVGKASHDAMDTVSSLGTSLDPSTASS